MSRNTISKTQNNVLLNNLKTFYNKERLDRMLSIINGESSISLRIVDWFSTNYSKKNFTLYELKNGQRFKVYNDYKLRLRAYSKKRFDPFCRWDRIMIPYDGETSIQTTLGQLNFFKWAIVNKVLEYIVNHFDAIEKDMNTRLNTVKRKQPIDTDGTKTRKKREELSINACKGMRKESCPTKMTF